jgi:hypothetical protein
MAGRDKHLRILSFTEQSLAASPTSSSTMMVMRRTACNDGNHSMFPRSRTRNVSPHRVKQRLRRFQIGGSESLYEATMGR